MVEKGKESEPDYKRLQDPYELLLFEVFGGYDFIPSDLSTISPEAQALRNEKIKQFIDEISQMSDKAREAMKVIRFRFGLSEKQEPSSFMQTAKDLTTSGL